MRESDSRTVAGTRDGLANRPESKVAKKYRVVCGCFAASSCLLTINHWFFIMSLSSSWFRIQDFRSCDVGSNPIGDIIGFIEFARFAPTRLMHLGYVIPL